MRVLYTALSIGLPSTISVIGNSYPIIASHWLTPREASNAYHSTGTLRPRDIFGLEVEVFAEVAGCQETRIFSELALALADAALVTDILDRFL